MSQNTTEAICVAMDQLEKHETLRFVGQEWQKAPGEIGIGDYVLMSVAGGTLLILMDAFLVVSGPKTGEKRWQPVKLSQMPKYEGWRSDLQTK